MKKVLKLAAAICAALVLGAGLVACNSGSDDDDEKGGGGPKIEGYEINISLINPWDYTWVSDSDLTALKAKEVEAFKVEIEVTDADGNAIAGIKDELALHVSTVAWWQNNDADYPKAKVGTDGKTYTLEYSIKKWESSQYWGDGPSIYEKKDGDIYAVVFDETANGQKNDKETYSGGYIWSNVYVCSDDAAESGWTASDVGTVKVAVKSFQYKLKGENDYNFTLVEEKKDSSGNVIKDEETGDPVTYSKSVSAKKAAAE